MKRSAMGGYGPIYDVLIPKLCRGGNYEKGRELWDEAVAMGVSLQSSIDVLDPSVTEVFKPTREVEEEVKLQNLFRNSIPRTRARIGKTNDKLFDLPFIREGKNLQSEWKVESSA
ncbi:pentatricopeptide repeat-containing protein At5g61370, mitochondrial-like [Euphorbia lathyris]|uniref:pentatricopeptide repeat-containing protein At5g61370, mitochondrial-like n=1 Tax=Euphorbia lathyris TaxID=212925 RepID=UPI003313EED7